jgi:hypothetical protein
MTFFLTCCAIHNQRKIISGSHLPWSDIEGMDEEVSDLSQTSAAIWRRLREQSRLDSMLKEALDVFLKNLLTLSNNMI